MPASTEPDGDSGEFPMTLKLELAPVVDQEDGQTVKIKVLKTAKTDWNSEPSVTKMLMGVSL
ncbi:hypothetical protein O9993_00725 [Vibrio lentus]|nr:hypothetical protein [Vibrio lentus]